jgi:hypothetical protein
MSAVISKPARPRGRAGKHSRSDARAQRHLASVRRDTRREENRVEQERKRRAAQARREAEERRRRAAEQRRISAVVRQSAHGRQEQKMLDLLRRGAGVTQILRETTKPEDVVRDTLRRAQHLSKLLDAVEDGAEKTTGVRMAASDLQRTRRFLGSLVALMRMGTAPNLAS